MALKEANIYTITSVKGGTGKTITTINLAGCLSLNNKKTLIIDLDLYTGSIALLLKLNVKKDLFDIVNDLNNNSFDTMDSYITKYNDQIDVIAAPKDPRTANKISSKYLSIILSKLKYKYDVILIDTSHILDEINLVALDSSSYILYIINNDMMDLKNMRTMVSIYNDMEKENYKIVLNDSREQHNYFTKADMKHMINDNIDYIIPSTFYIKNIEKYLLDGVIPTLDKKIRSRYKKNIEIYEKMLVKLDNKEQNVSKNKNKKV